MSWIGWTMIGILAANVIFFGGLLIAHIIAERNRKDEQRGPGGQEGPGMD